MDEHRTTSNRRRAAAMAGALLAAGLLTACGGSGSGGSASSAGASVSGSPSSSAPSSPAPDSPSASPTASPTPSASAAQPTTPGIAVGEPDPTAVKIPATGYRMDSPTAITVFFEAGVCDKYGLKVEEDTPPVLKVRVVIAQTAPRGQVCPQVIKAQQVTATLSKPVKSGAVVDLATGAALSPNSSVPAGGPR